MSLSTQHSSIAGEIWSLNAFSCQSWLFRNFAGIAFTIIGVVIVSLANLIFPTDSNGLEAGSSMTWSRHGATKMDGNILLGISMTLLSAFLAAGRLVAEELALEGTDLHPFQVGILSSTLTSYFLSPRNILFLPLLISCQKQITCACK